MNSLVIFLSRSPSAQMSTVALWALFYEADVWPGGIKRYVVVVQTYFGWFFFPVAATEGYYSYTTLSEKQENISPN